MKRIVAALLLFCLPALPSRANLGETIAQCTTRYGTPVHFTEADSKAPFGTIAFVAGGYALIVFVSNGKEVGARFSKVDKSALSDADQQNIMSADSGPSPWIPTKSDDPSCLTWTRSDQAKALYDKEKHMLIFTSAEMSRLLGPTAQKPVPAAGNAH